MAPGPPPMAVPGITRNRQGSSRRAANQDTCTAECGATWHTDDATCTWLWDALKGAPAPVGYDPAIIPPWAGGPTSDAFAALRLDPWRLRVMPGTVMTAGTGTTRTWRA